METSQVLPGEKPFSGEVALVTGAGRGIGAHIARGFHQAGASLALGCKDSCVGAEELASEINGDGGNAKIFQADVTQPDEVSGMFTVVVKQFGRIDILVNNAGTYPVGDLLDMDPREWDRVLHANLTSAFLCTQGAARQMVKQGEGGCIINISSIEALSPAPGHSHYAAAKAGLNALTKAAALELGRHGIRVNAVAPGLIWREDIEESWPEGVARWQKAAPLGRLGKGADVANACLYLASPSAEWITGVILTVDGGMLVNQTY